MRLRTREVTTWLTHSMRHLVGAGGFARTAQCSFCPSVCTARPSRVVSVAPATTGRGASTGLRTRNNAAIVQNVN